MKSLFSLNKYFIKYKWRYLLGILFIIGSNYFKVLQPQLVSEALDSVISALKQIEAGNTLEIQENVNKKVFKLAGLVLLYSFIMGLFMYFMRQTIIVTSRLIEYDLKKAIYSKFQELDISFHKTYSTGDLMSRATEDVSKVRMYLGPAVLYTVNLTATLTFVVYRMIQVSPTLSIYTLIPLPFLSFTIYYISNLINKKTKLIQAQLSKITSESHEAFSGIRIAKSYYLHKVLLAKFDTESEKFKDLSMELAKINAYFRPLMVFLIGLSSIIVVYVASIQVINEEISFGKIVEFIIYVGMLTWPVTAIGWIASMMQQASASQERIDDILLQKALIKKHGNKTPFFNSTIAFKNVSFTYPETNITALQNINFSINAGDKVGIYGKVGSGKSSLASLLLRIYDPEQGSVLIDNTDLKDFDLPKYKDKISYVPQNVFLFSDSILNNINFGLLEGDINAVKKAAKNAGILQEIEKLPNGFETVIGERGVTLSGGQKQRISLARALMKKPEIIILDDSMSALDSNTELKILDFLSTELKETTTFIITHRISPLFRFDKILVFDNGNLVQIGTHEELIAKKGYYFDLFKEQSQKKNK